MLHLLGPDYMANFRLHGEGFSLGRNSAQAKNPSLVFQTGLGFSARPNGPENQKKKKHVIETGFQPELESELGHAQ